MNAENDYKKWLNTRSMIRPPVHMADQIMARIKSSEIKSSNQSRMIDTYYQRFIENNLMQASLGLGLALVGLFRLAYVSSLILMP
ncbi:MAG: hypothetical protein KKD44_22470 [Proteobacteria bacterium]|nr:hypothetical protein [Pseudomonadota bacterium]